MAFPFRFFGGERAVPLAYTTAVGGRNSKMENAMHYVTKLNGVLVRLMSVVNLSIII